MTNMAVQATGAFYRFAVNRVEGGKYPFVDSRIDQKCLHHLAIIAKNINSPAASVVEFNNWCRKAAPGELPDIHFCSDIYWAYWVRDNPNIKNFRVYGAHDVINDDTVLLVAKAFRNNKIEALSAWPGTSFAADTDEGKALIGKR